MQLPQKRFYRQRAHCNPWSDHSFNYPINPEVMDWSVLYNDGNSDANKGPEFADIGCGYGGMLTTLSPLYPNTRMIGMEIRVKVSDYVTDRIKALRDQNSNSKYGNIAVIRTNAMKYMPNYFRKAQLSKMFILYPDPHFKRIKHKWRIISTTLLAEYAYVLREGARLYTITDVHDVHLWIVEQLATHPLFRRLSQEEMSQDPIFSLLPASTEEGKKVERNHQPSFPAIFERIHDPVDDQPLDLD